MPMPRPGTIPLSFAQERLWFLDQLSPRSTTYLNPAALRMSGALNAQALERSLQEVIHRHEILRTTFVTYKGQPMQVIHPVGTGQGLVGTGQGQAAVPTSPCSVLPLIDLQGLEKASRTEAAQVLARQEAQRPCDLEKGPLLRTHLVRLVGG